MDPVSVILSALAVGASKAAGEAALATYHTLTERLRSLFHDDPEAEQIVVGHLKDLEATKDEPSPEHEWEPLLRKRLARSDAGRDAELLAAARAVLTTLGPEVPRAGHVVTAGNVTIGSGATVDIDGDVASATLEIR